MTSVNDSASRPPLLLFRDLIAEPAFRPALEAGLESEAPQLRAELPRDLSGTWKAFSSVYRYLLAEVEASGGDREKISEVLDWCHDIGYDLAKYEIREEQYEQFGDLLGWVLADVAGLRWRRQLRTVHDRFYAMITDAIAAGGRQAVADAGAEGIRVGARVVEVLRPTRDLAVVRLFTDRPIDYLPGQYLSVLTPYVHAQWRHLSPSLPTNPARQIEFHVRAVPGGAVSPALVSMVQPGDRWVLAHPLGELEIHRDAEPKQDVLLIAGGTGIAPIRSILFDISRFSDNPRVHLFYGARFPGELYDLHHLVELASHAPWLTVQPVAEERSDPWWLDTSAAPELPQALHRFTYGRLDEVVTAYGGWSDRQIILAGPPAMLRATKAALIAKGAPPENISHDPLPGT